MKKKTQATTKKKTSEQTQAIILKAFKNKKHKITLNESDIIFTQQEFTFFLKGIEDTRPQGDEALASYLTYTRYANSVKNILEEEKGLKQEKKNKTSIRSKKK